MSEKNELRECLKLFCDDVRKLETEIGRVLIEQNAVIHGTVIAMIASGHILLEGVSGLVKTLLVNTLSEAVEGNCSRIQFTPDLMPTDLTETNIMWEVPDGGRRFDFWTKNVFLLILWLGAGLFFNMAGTALGQEKRDPLHPLPTKEAEPVTDFWYLKDGAEPNAENRLKVIQNVGTPLFDFIILQPSDESGEPRITFPEQYRQKLINAGFVFEFITKEQLAKTVHTWSVYHLSPHGQVSILVVPEDVPFTLKELQKLPHLHYTFIGKAFDSAEPDQSDSGDKPGIISLAECKKEIEEEREVDQENTRINRFTREAKLPFPMPHRPYARPGGLRIGSLIDQVGENLPDAVGMFQNRAHTLPEPIVPETGLKLLSRRGIVPGNENMNIDSIDVVYVFANPKENAKPVDGWFRLQELSRGRFTGSVSYSDGSGGMFFAKDDMAVLMDPASGKVGKASIRDNPDSGAMEIRLQIQPGQTQAIRVVRERWGDDFEGLGFAEFEALPNWEYERK